MSKNDEKPWVTFLSLVKERPDPSLKIDEFFCPYCKSKNVKHKEEGSTLVGGGGDVNHVWTKVVCLDCRKESMHEHRDYNSWYTDGNHKVIAGIPSCFEFYVYTCSHCGGEVTRKYFELDSENEVRCLRDVIDEKGEWVKKYRTIFECKSCHEKIRSDVDFWHKNCHKRPKPYKQKDLKIGWSIYEKIGILIINKGIAD